MNFSLQIVRTWSVLTMMLTQLLQPLHHLLQVLALFDAGSLCPIQVMITLPESEVGQLGQLQLVMVSETGPGHGMVNWQVMGLEIGV